MARKTKARIARPYESLGALRTRNPVRTLGNVPPRKAAAFAEFQTWLKMKHPELFNAAMMDATGRGMASLTDFLSDFTDSVARLGTAYVSTRVALETVKLNSQRAQQGLPPLSENEVAAMSATTVLPQTTVTPTAVAPAPMDWEGFIRDNAVPLGVAGALLLVLVVKRK